MPVNENDIGLVSYDEFDSHQKNSDTDIQHVTAEEKNAWNAKADDSSFGTHKNAAVLDHPDESVTTPKIADEAVETSKVADGAITKDKLDPVTVQTPLDAAGTHAADKTNPHSVTKAQVGLGNVDNAKQATKTEFDSHRETAVLDHPDKSVTSDKLADNAVTEGKIGSGAVTVAKLGANAVETAKIKDGAVTAAKVGSNAVTTVKLADGAITAAKIGANAVTKEKIADGAVSEAKFDTDLSASFKGKENKSEKGQANGYAPLDENGKLADEYLYGVTVKQYGARWKGTSSTICERLGDAAGLVANAHKGSTDSVQNDFDNIYPWSDMRLCNIDADGNILAYDGEPTFARDGANGDVMVEIPKFYYKRVKTGVVEEWWVCAVKLPGYELHPVFMNDGQEVSKVFHSAYNASSYTDEADSKVKLQSITGVQPRTRTTRANFRTYARNKGSIWSIEDISCINALHILYLVEYANTNSQAALGNGASSLAYSANQKALAETTEGNEIIISSSYKNTFKVGQRIEIGSGQGVDNKTLTPRTITAITTDEEAGQTTITFDGNPITIAVGNMIWNVAPLNGTCDELDGKSGWIAGENNYTSGYADINYRGIEGFHAKLWRFVDGVNIKDHIVHYANSLSDYADGVYTGKYSAIGYENCKSNGYASAFGYDEKAPWVMFPTAATGSSSTYLADYYYQNTGERLLLLGGNWLDGSNAGAFSFHCFTSLSYSGLYYGAHLLVKKP